MRIRGIILGVLGIGAGLAPALRSQEVAIYRDLGVWKAEGERALPAVLEWLGLRYVWIDAAAIDRGALFRNGKPAFRLLVVPGGWAASYIAKVGGWSGAGPGDDQIRAFVKAGGGYLGFCAGAFAAASTTRWLGRNYAYPWKLFDGIAEGPLPWNPLRSGRLGAVHGKAVPDLASPELKERGLSALVRVLLYGGPRFRLRDPKRPPPSYRVLARHGEDGSAAVVSYRYPTNRGGRVVLSSFHPSVLCGDRGRFDRDENDLSSAGAGRDPDGFPPDWRFAAALVDLAAGRPPRRPPPMPRARIDLRALSPLRVGGSCELRVQAPPAPGTVYLLLASTARSPGLRLSPSVFLPLRPGPLLAVSLGAPAVFRAFVGTLDAGGTASARIVLPNLAGLRGFGMEFAGLTFRAGAWSDGSNPVGLTAR